MAHVGIPLYAHQFRRSNRTVFADAADIVSAQVHQHHMFRPFLGIVQHLFDQQPVLRLVRTPPASPGQWTHRHPAVLGQYHRLGRGPDNMHVVQPQIKQVGRWIQPRERPVHIEGIPAGFHPEPLGQHHLEDVPRGDVFLGRPHRILEVVPGHVGRHGPIRLHGRAFIEGLDRRLWPVDPFQHVVYLGHALPVGRCGVRGIGQHVDDHVHALARVVENHNLPCHDEVQVGHHQVVRVVVRNLFEVPNDVVTEVSHGAAREPGQVFEHRGPVFPHDFPHQLDGVALQRQHPPVVDPVDPLFRSDDTLKGIRAYEGIPRRFLIAFHTLQQEGVPVSRADPVEGFLGRFICQVPFVPDGHQGEIGLAVVLQKGVVGCPVHGYRPLRGDKLPGIPSTWSGLS